jgi:hypothetical protein
MTRHLTRISIVLTCLMVTGCTTFVPVALDPPKLPRECRNAHPKDLPAIPPMKGQVSPDELNKHWARNYRLKARPRYRSLRRSYAICSRYARAAGRS